jgi:CheY-like chemotaxis protein
MSLEFPVLLADDDDDAVFLMRRAFQKSALSNPLFVARDGQDAVDYLQGIGPYADRQAFPLPRLLLLDIHMPRLNGFDVLGWIRTRPELAALPIVMFSSSSFECDKRKAQELGAHEYRVKTDETQDMVAMLHELHARWLAPPAPSSPTVPL